IRPHHQSHDRQGARPHCARQTARARRRGDRMKRREFITLLGGAAVARPLAARAQQTGPMRRVGVLMGVADDAEGQARVKALQQGLQGLGWIEGRNVSIDYRWTGGDATRARTYAAKLAKLSPDVIVAQTPPVIAAMRQATSSIPIVFAAVLDPESHGFIDSLARPGGNLTGTTNIEFSLVGKMLEVLKDVARGTIRAAVMF